MIAFHSPEGAALRALKPSRSAVVALWFAALSEDEGDWAAWAGEQLADQRPDVEIAALRFLQAAQSGNDRAARQLWTLLASFSIEGNDSRIVKAARTLRQQLPF